VSAYSAQKITASLQQNFQPAAGAVIVKTIGVAVSSILRRKLDLISFGFKRIRPFVPDCVSLFLAQTLSPARSLGTNALAEERLGFNFWTADFKSVGIGIT
jgi:hypothetical protein